jgi:hypothetical protein
MIFAIEPLFVPSFERGFQGVVKEVTAQASLNTNTTNNLLVSNARLIFQEEIMLEQRKVGVYGEISLAQIDQDDDLENGVRVEMDQLNLVVMQKTAEEFTGRETKSALEKGR